MMDSARERREDDGGREDLGSKGNFRRKSRYTFPDSSVGNQFFFAARVGYTLPNCLPVPFVFPPSPRSAALLRKFLVPVVGDTAKVVYVATTGHEVSRSFFVSPVCAEATHEGDQ